MQRVSANETSTCPRCETNIDDLDFYGVCDSCAAALRQKFDGSPRGDVASAEYEPKMNVTPNAVASKE